MLEPKAQRDREIINEVLNDHGAQWTAVKAGTDLRNTLERALEDAILKYDAPEIFPDEEYDSSVMDRTLELHIEDVMGQLAMSEEKARAYLINLFEEVITRRGDRE